MKINLLRNSKDTMSGYLNIDPFSTVPERTAGDLTDLDRFCEDAEAEEIIARDVIDFFEPMAVDRAIDNWVRKLQHGGKLIVGGMDLFDISKAISVCHLSVADANKLIHGPQDSAFNLRKSNSTLLDMCERLKDKGLKIISKRSGSMFKFTIVAERP